MKKKLFAVLALFSMVYCPLIAGAEFGVGGTTTTLFSGYWSFVDNMVVQPDGKIIVVGGDPNESDSDFRIARYNLDGNLDTEFGTNGRITTLIADNSGAKDVTLQRDGKIVVAGWSSLGGKKSFALARYNDNGSLDTSFANYGTTTTAIGVTEEIAYSVIQQLDGKLVVCGSTRSGTDFSFALVRYQANGYVDPSFGTNGVSQASAGTNYKAYSLIQQSDGKLLAAGYGNGGLAIARYDNFGSLDTSFGGSGTGFVTSALGSSDGIQQIIRQMDGKLVVVGDGLAGLAVARYSSEGVLDTTFNGTGIVTTKIDDQTWGYSIVQQPDGKLVAAGMNYDSGVLQYSMMLVRYTSSGSLDTSFGSGGYVTTLIENQSKAKSVLLQPDGKILASGDYNNRYGFALARYLTDGSLDTQDDPPLMTEIGPECGLEGQTLDLVIRGWNLGDVVAVQLRNDTESVNASNIVVDDTEIMATFTLSVGSGSYDLYLGTSTINRTFSGVFSVCGNVASPVEWEVNNLGKAGTPITGTMDIAVGDVDGDDAPEIYIANGDDEIHRYRKTTSWSTSSLPTSSGGFFQNVILADMDLDGTKEVYAGNSFPRMYQYKWSGSSWSGNSFAAYSGKMMNATKTNGWLSELIAVSGSSLMQTKMQNSCLYNSTNYQNFGTIVCGVSGDADNDGINEAYFSSIDHAVYQTWYREYVDVFAKTIFVNSADIISMVIGDADNDESNELYSADSNGVIHQIKWNGTFWNSSTVYSGSTPFNEIAINDGDDDGNNELYAAGQDGHLYQIYWNASSWQSNDLAGAGQELIAMAIGDGDADGQHEVYGVGEDGDVYQFKAVSIPATPTPTATVSPTASPTPTVTQTSDPLPDKPVVFCVPNPVRGDVARVCFLTKQPAKISAKMFTTSNQFVFSFDRNYGSPGKYTEEINVSNLANGVYIMLVNVENADGGKDRLVYKFAVVQ